MRKTHLLVLALLAVSALFTVAAAPAAFAEDEWLVNGAKITTELPTDYEGEYLLEDMNAPGGPVDFDCSELMIIDINFGGLDLILEILNLDGTAPPIICLLLVKGACTGAVESEIKVEPLNLPWEGEITLSGSKFIEKILSGGAGNPGYLAECNTLLGKIDDSCTGETGVELVNVTGGVEGIFSESEEITKASNCTLGGEKQGLIVGHGLTTSTEGTVAVS